MLGVGYNSCTAFHVVEQRMNVPYKTLRVNPKAMYRDNRVSCKTPPRTVGTEPDPPEDTDNGLFSTMEGRPPCRPREFCKRLNGKVFPLPSRIVERATSYDFTIMADELRAEGVVQEGRIGEATAMMLSSAGVAACVERRLRQDPHCFFRGYVGC